MRTQQEISAGFLPAEIADALGVPRGGAALIVTRRHRDLKKRLVGVGIHTHPAERYSILTEI
jgi:DNA-binding GntR family transcriptional regulator